MSYSETLIPMSSKEKRKELLIMTLSVILIFLFVLVGYLLIKVDAGLILYCLEIPGLIIVVYAIPKIKESIKEGFFHPKIIYKGIIKERDIVKISNGKTSAYEFVLEKKTLHVGVHDLVEKEDEYIFPPVKGEEVEIHALPKSRKILKILINRDGHWIEPGVSH